MRMPFRIIPCSGKGALTLAVAGLALTLTTAAQAAPIIIEADPGAVGTILENTFVFGAPLPGGFSEVDFRFSDNKFVDTTRINFTNSPSNPLLNAELWLTDENFDEIPGTRKSNNCGGCSGFAPTFPNIIAHGIRIDLNLAPAGGTTNVRFYGEVGQVPEPASLALLGLGGLMLLRRTA